MKMGRIVPRAIVGSVMGATAAVLLIICVLSIGWYYYSSNEEEKKAGMKYGLSERRSYATNSPKSEWRYGESELGDMFGLMKIFVIIGIVLAFIFVVLSILSGVRLIPGIIPLSVGMLAGLLVIIAPVGMVFEMPSAMEDFTPRGHPGPWDSFWGSETVEGVELSWGPDWCWYTAIISAVMLFVAGWLLRGIERPFRYEPYTCGPRDPVPGHGPRGVHTSGAQMHGVPETYEELYGSPPQQ